MGERRDEEEAPPLLFPLSRHFKCIEDKDERWKALDILSHANRILIGGFGQDNRQDPFVALTELVMRLPGAIPTVLPPDTKPFKEELDAKVHPSRIFRERAILAAIPGQSELESDASWLTFRESQED